MRTRLAQIAAEQSVDIAVENYSLERKAKRLIVFDVDSTLIQGEVIEMLAARAGAAEEVAAITGRPCAASSTSRSHCISGCRRWRVCRLSCSTKSVRKSNDARRPYHHPDSAEARLPLRCGLWRLPPVIEPLADELMLDFVAANHLEIVDGKLTGRVVGG